MTIQYEVKNRKGEKCGHWFHVSNKAAHECARKRNKIHPFDHWQVYKLTFKD